MKRKRIELDKIAIADVFVHKDLGLVSFQPKIRDRNDSQILRVRDIFGALHHVHCADCCLPTVREIDYYWKKLEEHTLS
jgi:hypothetical protein